MMRSMYSGVSGLAVHQSKMDVIGNNIANVNTIGFKSARVTFAEVFSQTMQNAAGPNENRGGTNPMQIGLGVGMSSIDVNMREGASQRTDNPLDMKIQGPGFFIVKSATGNKFTRAGAFRIDKAGNLVNPAGLNVMGWDFDEKTQQIVKGKVNKLQVLSAKNMSAPPTATKNITVGGNINKNDPAITDPTGKGSPFTMQFYDSLGYRYTGTFNIKTNTTAGTPSTYTVTMEANSVVDSEGRTSAESGVTNAEISFDLKFNESTGKFEAIPASTNATVDPANEPGMLTIPYDPAATASSGTSVFYSPFSKFDTLKIDFNSITQVAGNTNVEAVAGDAKGLGSGSAAGNISGYEVAPDGKIVGKYTNGATRILGQIVVAQFPNPEGLKKVGDNLFEATMNSGDFDGIGEDITSAGGAFSSGVIEMSNVDLSKEFTEMITTQRGFQANSRIITSSDEMLQELVNLKR